MRIPHILAVLIVLAAHAFALVERASACVCMPSGPPCQNAFRVDAVFSGTVRAIIPIDNRPSLPPGQMRFPESISVELDVIEAFRGLAPGTKTVTVSTSGDSDCGYAFEQDAQYLVYASGENDRLATGYCSRTRPLDIAAEDLAFLRSAITSTATHATLSGTIQHTDLDFAKGRLVERGGVPGVLMTATGQGLTLTTLTDLGGHYEFALPPGSYSVNARTSAGMAPSFSERKLAVRDSRACWVEDFEVHFDGRIRGMVQSSTGAPIAGATVDVLAVERAAGTGDPPSRTLESDAAGFFEAIDLPPGRYVVGVDLIRHGGPQLFPRTFHPGTANRTDATIVELSGGQRVALQPMTLPAPRRERRLSGTVLLADGVPASGVVVSLRDGVERARHLSGIRAAADGTFSFTVHEGLSYSVFSSHWNAQKRRIEARSGPIIVDAGGDPTPVTLILNERAQ